MNQHSSITPETEQIELTAAYGTAVVMTGTRRPAIRNHQPETLAGNSGNPTSRPNISTGADRHLGGPHSIQADDKAPHSVHPSAHQPIPLAAANDAGKRLGKQPRLRDDTNRRRKAA